MGKFKTVNELVNSLQPDYPVYCIRLKEIKKSVKFFKENFPGKILYAVKTNPNEKVIKQIINNGINEFDVASLNEIKLIKKIKPESKLHFMHTIKSKESISSAYFDYGVKSFSLDSKDELRKILEASGQSFGTTKPIFEVNKNHKLLKKLKDLKGKQFNSFVDFLYDYALIAEGGSPKDPAKYLRQLDKYLS